MTNTSIYQDISARTSGDIYIGVVGPVRTGKSTFIKRFMETLVIPNIENVYMRERARDELPQSGSGRTVMTAEPKFVPEEAVSIELAEGTRLSVRLIDSVGYMVEGVAGQMEEGRERMVTTPWFQQEIPISRAAEEGTRKVISEHSTIGIVVTTDGTVCDLPREAYIQAEERAIRELISIGKPFAVIVNSAQPQSESAKGLCAELTEKYGVSCIAVNCLELGGESINGIIKTVLFDFPVSSLGLCLPPWLEVLPEDNDIKRGICAALMEAAGGRLRMRDVDGILEHISGAGQVSSASVREIALGSGAVTAAVELPRELYYETVSEQSGLEIHDDGDLMALLTSMSGIKRDYERIRDALREVQETGYGVVIPRAEEMQLSKPEIVNSGGRYGVKLKASAPSIHMIMSTVETEVSPAVGGETASEEIISFLLQGFDGDVNRIWESNIFGKSLYNIAEEGLVAKAKHLPDNTRRKLRETIQRMVNEGSGGLICIIF